LKILYLVESCLGYTLIVSEYAVIYLVESCLGYTLIESEYAVIYLVESCLGYTLIESEYAVNVTDQVLICDYLMHPYCIKMFLENSEKPCNESL
jgi:hypothetical protein